MDTVLKDGEPYDPRIEKLFNHCFEIKTVENGMVVPVGGKSYITGELDYFVTCDFDSFADVFLEMEQTMGKILRAESIMSAFCRCQ